MPSTVRFKANRRGFTELANGPQAEAVVVAEATKAKGIAEGLAAEFSRTGEYGRSFAVVPLSLKIGRYYRAAARLENTAPHAAAVEVGNKSTKGKGHHVLSRTLDTLSGA